MTWIVLADGDGLGEAIARRLAAGGDRPVVVRRGDRFLAGDDGRRFTVRPAHREDFDQLLHRAAAAVAPLRGVLHLWALDAPAARELTPSGLAAARPLVCDSAVALFQALIDAPTGRPVLWFFTRGAQRVRESDEIQPAQTPLWGLARGVGHMEHRGL